MNDFASSLGMFAPIFGLLLCLSVYSIALQLYRRTGWMLAHPLLVSSGVIIGILQAADLSYEVFYAGAKVLNWLVGPATVALAVPLYKQRQSLYSSWQAVCCGVISGAVSGIVGVWVLGQLSGQSDLITLSLIPKSVTIPIGLGISGSIGGIQPLTICVTIITGIFGAMVGPMVLNLSKVKHDVARGIAMGAAAHGAGVQRALQENQVQGAMAGLSVGLMGVVSAIITPILIVWLFK